MWIKVCEGCGRGAVPNQGGIVDRGTGRTISMRDSGPGRHSRGRGPVPATCRSLFSHRTAARRAVKQLPKASLRQRNTQWARPCAAAARRSPRRLERAHTRAESGPFCSTREQWLRLPHPLQNHRRSAWSHWKHTTRIAAAAEARQVGRFLVPPASCTPPSPMVHRSFTSACHTFNALLSSDDLWGTAGRLARLPWPWRARTP